MKKIDQITGLNLGRHRRCDQQLLLAEIYFRLKSLGIEGLCVWKCFVCRDHVLLANTKLASLFQ